MYKIGIIGCQSLHADYFSALFNKEKIFPGFHVAAIWGDDAPDRLRQVARQNGIGQITPDLSSLLAASDAVVITTRDAAMHFDCARASLRSGKPVFVDKPFAKTPGQVRQLFALARQMQVALTGGSTLCYLPQITAFRQNMLGNTVCIRYKADPDSPFGGYAFYGSHLTDLCAFLFGPALSVAAHRTGDIVTGVVSYAERQVLLQSSIQYGPPQIIFERDGAMHIETLDDGVCYRYGMQAFVDAIPLAKNDEADRFSASVTLLSGLLDSLARGGCAIDIKKQADA